MQRPFSRRFGSASSVDPGPVHLLTATDAWVWIIRDIVITNQLNAAQLLQVYIQSGARSILLMVIPAAAAVTSYHLDLRQEILPSEELFAYSASGGVNCVVSGYALTPAA